MTEFWVQSTRVPDRRFKIIGLDKSTMTAELQGVKATFKQKVDPATLKALGYSIIKVEVEKHA